MATATIQRGDPMNLSDLRELISDLNASPLTAFEVDTADLKLKLSWHRPVVPPWIEPQASAVVRAPLAGIFSLTRQATGRRLR
jgi:hypothetical protein